jgi:hypothetical protein
MFAIYWKKGWGHKGAGAICDPITIIILSEAVVTEYEKALKNKVDGKVPEELEVTMFKQTVKIPMEFIPYLVSLFKQLLEPSFEYIKGMDKERDSFIKALEETGADKTKVDNWKNANPSYSSILMTAIATVKGNSNGSLPDERVLH